MSLSEKFTFRAGQVDQYIETIKAAGITDLIMVNGNFAIRYPEMINSVLGAAQWNFDRQLMKASATDEKQFAFLVTSDSDQCLNTMHTTEKLRPANTGMTEMERVAYILNPLRAQFSNRADGKNIECHAVLYDGIKNGTELQMTELDTIRDAGINLASTSKAWPWSAPHPLGSPVWFSDRFDNFTTTIWNDPKQGSVMEQDVRAARIAEIGDEIPATVITAVEEMIASGKLVNLHNQTAVVQYKGVPLAGSNGKPLVVTPEIGLHGAAYMEAAKPHAPLFPVEDAAKPFIRYDMV